jgi:hypothetical protein
MLKQQVVPTPSPPRADTEVAMSCSVFENVSQSEIDMLVLCSVARFDAIVRLAA